MKQTILITGAGGYIGSISTYLFLQNGYRVIALDNFQTGYRKPLEILLEKFGSEALHIYEQDLHENLDSLFEKETDIAAVIHYAASCLVDESMKNPYKYFYNNTYGTLNLLETLVRHQVKNFVFSSTCAVYGESQYVPLDEQHPTNPNNPYGESKRMVEKLIEWYGSLKGINYTILRYFNVCGAADDGLIGDSKKPSVLMVQNAVRGALGIEPFYITCGEVDTPDKTPIRDYINVVDLNEAHLKAVEYLLNGGKSEIINLGTGTGSSVLEIVKAVEEVTQVALPMQKATEPRIGEAARMIAAIGKAKQVLQWEPKRTLIQTVDSLVKWYAAHPHGWET
ncbi:UDP-glucose 4-epimerase GalE [Candidatus Roizmanbacteria bacterium]|nr:UDP-glucose 4-epimerase GalE [Candidatus Roizmanbacteria bacterium]